MFQENQSLRQPVIKPFIKLYYSIIVKNTKWQLSKLEKNKE